jgi:RimJ/RimL family protein N-acetyltransferase
MAEVLVVPTEMSGVELRQFSDPQDDIDYRQLLLASRDHLLTFEPGTVAKYPDLDAVREARLNPEPADKLRFGIRAAQHLLVGTVNITPTPQGAEIGYLLHADHQGHGYATAAARAAAAHAAKSHSRVLARVAEDNYKSVAVLERAGFRHTQRRLGSGNTHLVFDYGVDDVNALLAPQEHIRLAPPERGSQRRAHGYNYGAIENNRRTGGDSVVLTVEPNGAVEPVLITGDIALSVRSLKGSGWLVKYNVNDGGDTQVLPIDENGEPVTLRRGDAYYYLNLDDDELILRDDCTPVFQESDEVELAVVPTDEDVPDGRVQALPRDFYTYFGTLET